MVSNFPPLHPFIVHFPVSLFLLAGLFGFISLFVKREFWKEVLLKTLVAGAIFAPIAVVAGMIDEQKMNHGEIDPMLMIHKYNGIAIMLVFQILLVWFWLRKKIPGNKEYITWVLCLLLGTGMVLLQGYLGGELVFSKGMGVKPVEELGGGHGNKDNGNKKMDMNGKEDTKEGGQDKGHSEKDSKSSHDMTDKKSMKEGKTEMEIKDKTININITIDVPDIDMKKKVNVKSMNGTHDMKNMDKTKEKDDMKDMDHSKMDDKKKDGDGMKNMDHSKMNDNNKKGNDMKGMSMSGMEMKSPPDTFKFKDNNPAWQKAKKERKNSK